MPSTNALAYFGAASVDEEKKRFYEIDARCQDFFSRRRVTHLRVTQSTHFDAPWTGKNLEINFANNHFTREPLRKGKVLGTVDLLVKIACFVGKEK
jgi:hypothetical protein